MLTSLHHQLPETDKYTVRVTICLPECTYITQQHHHSLLTQCGRQKIPELSLDILAFPDIPRLSRSVGI